MINIWEIKLERNITRHGSDHQSYTDQQKSNLIAKWQSSGLSKAGFCRQEKIKQRLFYHWTRSAEKVKHKKVNLSPVKVTRDHSLLSFDQGHHQVIIELVNQIKIILPLPSSTQAIVKLVKELQCN